jgi:hypothetical protein
VETVYSGLLTRAGLSVAVRQTMDLARNSGTLLFLGIPRFPQAAADAAFWETAAFNRGFQVRLFEDLESALEWLGAGPEASDALSQGPAR